MMRARWLRSGEHVNCLCLTCPEFGTVRGVTGKRSGVLAACAALVLMLSACADGTAHPPPASTTSSSPSPRASETSTPTLSSPTLPSEASEPDRAGAEAFVRYWWSALNHANAAGDTSMIDAVSLPSCGSCAELSRQARAANTGGHHFVKGQVIVTSAVAAPIQTDGVVLVSTVIRQEATTIVAADGSVLEDHPAVPKASISFYAQLKDGAWMAYAIAPVEGT